MTSLVLGVEPVNSHVVSPWVPELFALLGKPLTYAVKGSLSAYSPGDKHQAWLCQQGSHLTTCLSLLIKSFHIAHAIHDPNSC